MKRESLLSIPYSGILLFIALFLNGSCSGNKENTASPVKAFTVNKSNDNFVQFDIIPELKNSSLEWLFPENDRIEGKNSVIYYFEKKGTYKVSVNYLSDGNTYVYSEDILITNNSEYFERGETLYWNDEFNDELLNNTFWNYDIGSNKEQNRWGNNEWQDYTDNADNSFFRDGKLIIKAIKAGEGQKVGDYTSARLTTKGKKEFNRGRIEVKAKLGGGRGLWPAIWLFQSSGEDKIYSELDIMEYVGVDKDIIYSAVHTNKSLSAKENTIGGNIKIDGVEDNFHVYGMNWTDHKIDFYVDNPENIHLSFIPKDKTNTDDWAFDKKLYLILNIAVGGDWGGMKGVNDSIFPKEMEIEYVRIFQKKGQGE